MTEVKKGAADLADAIAYQDAAIVSRILLKKKTGSVTLFAFDRGQELSEHTVPHDALIYVVEGIVAVTISGSKHTVGAGQVIRLPAGEPHAVAAESRFKMMLTMIRE